MIKFIYSEKAKKICEISDLLLSVCTVDKSKVEISRNFVAFSEYTNFNTGHSLSDQHCHPITQHMANYFVRFTKIYTNWFEIQNLQNLNFRTICVNLTESVVIFRVNWWQNMLIWQRTACISPNLDCWKKNDVTKYQSLQLLK